MAFFLLNQQWKEYIAPIAQKIAPLYGNDNTVAQRKAQRLIEGVIKIPLTPTTPFSLEQKERERIERYLHEMHRTDIPLEYLIHEAYFIDFPLVVSPPVLIPRVETEAWVVELQHFLHTRNHHDFLFVDLGCGTGCISIALLKEFPQSRGVTYDIDRRAVACTNINAKRQGVSSRITIIHDSYLSLPKVPCYDLLVANPPYIDEEKKHTLPKSVALWESPQALFSSDHGTEITRKILTLIPQVVKKSGIALIECDSDHSMMEEAIALNVFENITLWHDHYNRKRVLWITV